MNCVKPLLITAMTTLIAACSPQSSRSDSGANAEVALPSQSSAPMNDSPRPTIASEKKADSQSQAAKGDISMLRSSFSECIKASGGVVPDMQDCIESEFEYQDGRMSRAYGRLLKESTAGAKDEIESRQKKWLEERDAKCGWDAGEEGQGQRLEANDCFLEMTSLHADELEAETNAL